MAPSYRTTKPPAGFVPRRWHLLLLLALAIVVALGAITHVWFGQVVFTLTFGTLTLTLLIPAAMLGLLITKPLIRHELFSRSPWPDMFRLAIGVALGLGALALGVLLLGSLHLLRPHFALALPLLAAGAGIFHTRQFVKQFDRAILRAPATRGDLLVLLAAVPIAILLIAATFPPGGVWSSEAGAYDVREYHLQLPREYLANQSTAPLHHNVYSYLPANVEMLYALQMSVTALADDSSQHLLAIYPAQFLHASFALLTAIIVAMAPLNLSRAARLIALLAFLGTPWVLITGSLAYNDAGMLLFGAIAMALCFAPPSRAATIVIGVSLGLAIGCKLTAGTMFAVPVGLILLSQRRLVPLLMVILLSALIYSPWAFRAAADTKNPVFPMATRLFGAGHWTAGQAARWDAGHRAPEGTTPGGRLGALAGESLMSGNWSHVPFKFIGPLWLAFFLAAALAITRGPQAWLLLAALLIQLLFWSTTTHLQSRFLLPIVIPLAWLCALGASALSLPRTIITILIAVHAALAGLLLTAEAALPAGPAKLKTRPEAIGQLLSLPLKEKEETPVTIAQLERANVYLLGAATPYYYRNAPQYHTVFDADPLWELLVEKNSAIAKTWLQSRRADYLVVSYGEIARLADSYGLAGPAFHDRDRAEAFAKRIQFQIEFEMGLTPAPLVGEPGTVVYWISPPSTN